MKKNYFRIGKCSVKTSFNVQLTKPTSLIPVVTEKSDGTPIGSDGRHLIVVEFDTVANQRGFVNPADLAEPAKAIGIAPFINEENKEVTDYKEGDVLSLNPKVKWTFTTRKGWVAHK